MFHKKDRQNQPKYVLSLRFLYFLQISKFSSYFNFRFLAKDQSMLKSQKSNVI